MSEEQIKNLENQFEARITRDEKIEAKDWMPEKYRKTHIRQMSQHAHSKIVGMLPDTKNFIQSSANIINLKL